MNTPVLSLTAPTAPLTPDRAFTGRLVVRNTGPEVERYLLEPLGPLAPWTWLAERELRIWPGEAKEVRVVVQLPPTPQPPAGRTTVSVVARAADGASGVAGVPVEVSPRYSATLPDLVPHAIATTARALVHATVVNTGNATLQLRLTARDAEGRLAHEAGPGGVDLVLAPGQAATLPVVLRTTKTLWLGRPVRCDYTVEAASPQTVVSAPGVVTLQPVLRKWWFVVVGVLVVLVLGGGGSGDEGLLSLAGLALVAGLVVLLVVVLRRLRRLARDRSAPPPRPAA